MEFEGIDYYDILQCDKKASQEEIKRSYQNLVLTYHPDKKDCGHHYENFLNIQKAWSVLRDPQSRKQYDALLSCEEHNECLLYDTISVVDLNHNSQDGVYSYQCRCGGTYFVNAIDLIPPTILVECSECSLSIQINVSS